MYITFLYHVDYPSKTSGCVSIWSYWRSTCKYIFKPNLPGSIDTQNVCRNFKVICWIHFSTDKFRDINVIIFFKILLSHATHARNALHNATLQFDNFWHFCSLNSIDCSPCHSNFITFRLASLQWKITILYSDWEH